MQHCAIVSGYRLLVEYSAASVEWIDVLLPNVAVRVQFALQQAALHPNLKIRMLQAVAPMSVVVQVAVAVQDCVVVVDDKLHRIDCEHAPIVVAVFAHAQIQFWPAAIADPAIGLKRH